MEPVLRTACVVTLLAACDERASAPPEWSRPAIAADDPGEALPAGAVRRFGSNRLRATGHLALSPDGREVWAAVTGGRIHVWDVASGRVARVLTLRAGRSPSRPVDSADSVAHGRGGDSDDERILRLLFSPDGRWLATQTRTGVRVLDCATGAERAAKYGGENWKGALGFDASGSRLLVDDGGLCIWSVDDGAVTPLVPAGATASVAADGTAVILLWREPIEEERPRGGGGELRAAAVDLATGASRPVATPATLDVDAFPSPGGGGRIAWLLGGRSRVRFAVAEDAAECVEVALAFPVATPLVWLSDASAVVAAGAGGVVSIDARTGAVRSLASGGSRMRSPCGMSGRALVDRGAATRVIDLRTGERFHDGGRDDAMSAVAWSPSAARLAVCRADGSVFLYDAATGSVGPDVVAGPRPWTHWIRFGRGGATLRLDRADATDVVDLETGRVEEARRPRPPYAAPDGSAVIGPIFTSADDSAVAGFAAPDTLSVWDSATGARVASFKESERTARGPNSMLMTSVMLSSDGRFLATCTNDAVRVWRVGAEAPVRDLPVSSLPSANLSAISPDGSLLAFADARGFLHLVGTDGRVASSRHAHVGWASWSFSADGRWLASSGNDRTVLVWDVAAATR